jgi:DMSO/TMAO reductase YedYZ molybdopterin-dependent catalytic subunit
MSLDDDVRRSDSRSVQERRMRDAGRLPSGQSLTLKWPVLHEGEVPVFDPQRWDFKVGGLVERPLTLRWQDLLALPQREVVSDFHCVTRWSTFDNVWEGVPRPEIVARAGPRAEVTHVMVLGHVGDKRYGYSTNVPLVDLDRADVLLAHRHGGAPLAPEHGGPLRLVVPHLYAWKSAKWVRGLIFMDADRAGYWEQRGYHMYGDPFREQRLTND